MGPRGLSTAKATQEAGARYRRFAFCALVASLIEILSARARFTTLLKEVCIKSLLKAAHVFLISCVALIPPQNVAFSGHPFSSLSALN